MSAAGFLEQALKLLRHKGTEKELIDIAKNLNPAELETLKSAYKAQFKPGYYHGTPASEPFKSFDLSLGKAGADDGPIGAAFVTKNPEFAKNFTGIDRKGKVLPMRVNTSNIFDYQNPEHIAKLVEEVKRNPLLTKVGQEISEEPFVAVNGKKLNPYLYYIRRGDWEMLEHPETIKAIKNLGFDGMHVAESGEKNIALFNPNVDARYENAEFNPLKKDTGNLVSSLGVATGAGLAASSAMPEDAEASPISKVEDIAKVVSKLKNPTTLDLMKELNYPKFIRSQKQAQEAHIAASNLLDFAIREGTGNTLSAKNSKVAKDWINLARPHLKSKIGESIHGLDDKLDAVFAYMDRRIPALREANPEMSYQEAYKTAQNEIANSGGMYWANPNYRELKNGNTIYGPGDIYLFNTSPSTVEHEAEHLQNHITNPLKSKLLNASYELTPNVKSHIKTDLQGAFDRVREFAGLSQEEFVDELLKKGVVAKDDNGQIIIPFNNDKKFDKYLADRFRLLPNKPNYSFGNHFLDYNHFEPERSAEILSDKIKMPVGNPLENEMTLNRITKGEFSDEELPALFEKMQERGKTEEIPKNFMEYKKRQFERPVYDQPKILSEAQNRRLSVLEKEFEGEEF